jgi:hypothetical protein
MENSMPRYYFDIDDGERVTRDDEGHDYGDRDGMKAAAITVLPEIASDVLPDGDQRTFSVQVRDSGQNNVFLAKLSFTCEWLDRI